MPDEYHDISIFTPTERYKGMEMTLEIVTEGDGKYFLTSFRIAQRPWKELDDRPLFRSIEEAKAEGFGMVRVEIDAGLAE